MLLSRRHAVQSLGMATAALACGCASNPEDVMNGDPHTIGHLTSRPAKPSQTGDGAGLHQLNLGQGRDGFVVVPSGYNGEALPLALMLHGAGGSAERALRSLRKQEETVRMLILAVDSRRETWDMMYNDLGDDVAFIDDALDHTFSRYAVDRRHIAVGGFSDGASYALSLGIANGDLFTHVIAFSPGYMRTLAQVGRPMIFISHGTADQILPIERCSRRLVPVLTRAGYPVKYREFDGPHTVPEAVAHEALQWFVR